MPLFQAAPMGPALHPRPVPVRSVGKGFILRDLSFFWVKDRDWSWLYLGSLISSSLTKFRHGPGDPTIAGLSRINFFSGPDLCATSASRGQVARGAAAVSRSNASASPNGLEPIATSVSGLLRPWLVLVAYERWRCVIWLSLGQVFSVQKLAFSTLYVLIWDC